MKSDTYMRNIVDFSAEVVKKEVLNEFTSKYTTRSTVKTITKKAMKLECGHLVLYARFNKEPKTRVKCGKCWCDGELTKEQSK